jgi:hypothetical protein
MNIDQLEDDVRAALAARADEVPTGAAARVRTRDYRPRTRSVRPPVAVGGVTIAAATGVAVWLFALSPQTSTAFAGWSTTPTTAAPGQVSTAESTCESRIAALPAGPPTSGQKPPALGRAGLQPVLSDTRGAFTWVILANGDASTYASCISGPSLSTVSATSSSASQLTGSNANTSASNPPPAVPAGQVALSSSSQTTTPNGDSYSFAEGRAGNGVTAAALVLSDGTHVEATLQNGWFAAWWPGDRTLSSALVTTASGTTTEHLSAGPGGCTQLLLGPHSAGTYPSGSFDAEGGHSRGLSQSSVGSWQLGSSTARTGSTTGSTARTGSTATTG